MKIKGFIDVVELAGFLGTMLLALLLFGFSMSKGYVVEGYIGFIFYLVSMLIYKKIDQKSDDIIIKLADANKLAGQKNRFNLLNGNILFSYMLSIWAIAIILFSMSYLGICIFPIKFFLLSVVGLFTIFFAESAIASCNWIAENKIPIVASVLGCIYITTNQTFEVVISVFTGISILLFANMIVSRMFEYNINSYRDLLMNTINRYRDRKVIAIITILTIFMYCIMSNIIIDVWKLSLGIIVISLIAYFIYEQIFGGINQYSNSDQYFYRNSYYLARDATSSPKYTHRDTDRHGNRLTKEEMDRIKKRDNI